MTAEVKRLPYADAIAALSNVVPREVVVDFIEALGEGREGQVMVTPGARAGMLRRTWERRAKTSKDPNVTNFARNLSKLDPEELVQAYTAEIGTGYIHLRVVLSSQRVIGIMRRLSERGV